MNAATTGFLGLPILPKFDSANQFKFHNSNHKITKVEVKSVFVLFTRTMAKLKIRKRLNIN